MSEESHLEAGQLTLHVEILDFFHCPEFHRCLVSNPAQKRSLILQMPPACSRPLNDGYVTLEILTSAT